MPLTGRPKIPGHSSTAKKAVNRNRDTAKATAANRLRKAEKEAAGEADRDDVSLGRALPLNIPKPPPGATWMLDEVIRATLSADDAILSRQIMEAIAKKAQKGDIMAAGFLADRSQGRAPQKVTIDGGLTVNTLDSLLPEVPHGSAPTD